MLLAFNTDHSRWPTKLPNGIRISRQPRAQVIGKIRRHQKGRNFGLIFGCILQKQLKQNACSACAGSAQSDRSRCPVGVDARRQAVLALSALGGLACNQQLASKQVDLLGGQDQPRVGDAHGDLLTGVVHVLDLDRMRVGHGCGLQFSSKHRTSGAVGLVIPFAQGKAS